MTSHNFEMKDFWFYYLLAVMVAILGMCWIAFGNGMIYEALHGEPMLPDPYTFVGMLMQQTETDLGLPSDSILASLAMTAEHWYMILSYLFPAAPSIAAILIVWHFSRGTGVKSLFRCFSTAQEGVSAAQGLKFLGVLFLAIVVYSLVFATLSGISADGDIASKFEALRLDAPLVALLLLLVGSFTAHGAILEELGWRGFAWPLLQKVMSTPLRAAIFLGLLWGTWHLPREVVMLAGGAPFDEFFLDQINFFMGAVTLTIIIGWAVNKAGGSILPAIMIHGASNYLGGTLGYDTVFLIFSIHDLLKIAIAITVVAFTGSQLGYRGPSNAIGRSETIEAAGA